MYHPPLDRKLQTLQNMVLATLARRFAKRSFLKRTELLQSQRELRISRKTLENPNPSHFWEKNLAYMKNYT